MGANADEMSKAIAEEEDLSTVEQRERVMGQLGEWKISALSRQTRQREEVHPSWMRAVNLPRSRNCVQ
jgi:hypothetical protein